MSFKLTGHQIRKLRRKLRKIRGQYIANRILVVLALSDCGYSVSQVAKLFDIGSDTVRRYFRLFQEGGVNGLLEVHYKGRQSYLTEEQKKQLKEHLNNNIYLDVKPIIAYVYTMFNVKYSIPGMTKLLHELNFVYKKPKICLGRADVEAQIEWVKKYNDLRKNADKTVVFYFVDVVHPQHNSKPAYGWIEKGVEKEIKTNSGRQRLNINGALNIDAGDVVVDTGKTINRESMKRLMNNVVKKNRKAIKIYMILDNARYYYCKEVEEYRQKLGKIEFMVLPLYSPNLNIVERIWKFFKKKILYNKYMKNLQNFQTHA
ncbi:MAG: IS630 family transposase [Planctomycetaceae bacterium]|jgi:transposase|nr:IS630 family transposase [Planctomycetaceae bacterium]